MKGIVGRKLGMTQLFDPESGVVTPVTVIEAGPCPVVQVSKPETDGYEAIQLAFEPVAERKLTKGELGHLRKTGAGAHRHLVEFRGPSELTGGDTVTVEIFQPGDKVKIAGIGIGKGFQGTIKRHNFAAVPSRTARTTSASAARSVPRRGPRASLRAYVGRANGRQASHAGRSNGARDRREQT